MNPIEKAVLPLKADAITRAEQEARAEITRAHEALEKAGWDINKAAPYPSVVGHGSLQFFLARAKHSLYHSLTEPDPARGYQISNGTSPYFVAKQADREARYIHMRREGAAADYDAFVAKLTKKIGEVKWAELDGNHVWGYSTLLVETIGGETQAWKTQQIVNVSKHGKHFNQWPTRKIKLATKGATITGRTNHTVPN